MIYSTLKLFDLNQKEADLYLEMLAIGTQAASVLARRLKLPRSSVQFLAESLVKKGIATKQSRRNITTYQPIAPEDLVALLESGNHEYLIALDQQVAEITALVPRLQELQGSLHPRPQVSVFEGREGLKRIFEDSLTAQEMIRILGNREERPQWLPDYFPEYERRRMEKGVAIRAIYPGNEDGSERRESDLESRRESLLIDRNKYQWHPEIRIYDNKVTVASDSDRGGVIIESKEITRAMKVLFDLAWNRTLREQQQMGQKGSSTEAAGPAAG